ncbi:YncE family protein [Sphingomonas sp. RB3P16]|uniref:YncE family protein n=1 Tax=Parasphingomonas frigoris TaxID=3096163 RepID=UPI002FC86199
MRAPILSLLAAAALPLVASAAPTPAYRLTESIAGPDGGWDYARVDDAGQRLYVARGDAVTVVNLATKAVSSIEALQRGHAVVPLPGGKLLVTSGNDGTVRLVDLANGRESASIAVGKKPDAAILDATAKHAYVMNAGSGTISVINLATAKVVKTIAVKPALEYAAFSTNDMLFVNDEDANEIETIDVVRGAMGKPIPLPGCEGPTGLGYDARHDRLIAACANGKAAIVDVTAQRLTALVAIGAGPDAVVIDAKRGLAFIPCGANGVLEILSIGGMTVERVATVKTEIGARTGALDSKTGTIYLPTAKFGPPVVGTKRQPMIPGSFHILSVRPA